MRQSIRRHAHGKRVLLVSLALFLGFALRLHALQAPDLDIDETWSYLHAHYLTHSAESDLSTAPGYLALAVEPNNALHLLLSGLIVKFVPNAIGLRWGSLMAGIVSIAIITRIAHRLFHQEAITVTTAFLAAVAYAPIVYSQLGRPYMLATCFGLLSLLFWLEDHWKANMLTGILTVLSHVGALPLILVQDVLAVWAILRRKPINVGRWIISRIGIYTVFLMVLWMVHLRLLDGKVISSEQTMPTLPDILNHLVTTLHGTLPQISTVTPADLLFLLAVVLPAGLMLGYLAYRRELPAGVGIPLLWIGLSYAALVGMVIVGNGAIKFMHIMHIAFAVVLLLAVAVVRAPRPLGIAMLTALIVANVVTLQARYTAPYREFTTAMIALEGMHPPGENFYYNPAVPTAIWALQLNHPLDTGRLQPLPEAENEWAPAFHFLAYHDWSDPLPTGCNPIPIWTQAAFHLHACVHAGV